MGRSVWTGSISFGLVNIPVKLFPATRSHRVAFHEFEEGTGQRIRYKRVAEKSGHDVPWQKIRKGLEIGKGRYVVLTEDELRSAEPGKTASIEIEQFVALNEIDPVNWDQTYYLGAAGPAAAKAYALLLRAMEDRGRVALGRFVMRTKEHVVCIRPYDGALALATMFFPDEVKSPGEVADLPARASFAPRELAMAGQLIDSLAAPWEPDRFKDTFTERVMELAHKKKKGEEIVVPEAAEESGQVVDLMEALKATLAARRGSAARPGGKVQPAKRAAARGAGKRAAHRSRAGAGAGEARGSARRRSPGPRRRPAQDALTKGGRTMSEQRHEGEGIGIATAVLLAAATVGSAWCAYQATLWSGDQIRSLAAANTAHVESLRKTASANVSVLIDVSTFLSYMQNRARGDDKLAEFIRTHARKEFRPILEAWIAEQKPGVEPTDLPFKPPRYQVADTRAAELLEKQAAQGIERSNNANANGDLFVFHTVMFALALFFLGATSEARRLALRRIMLGLGALVFTLSVISMARLPRALSEAQQKHGATSALDQPHQ